MRILGRSKQEKHFVDKKTFFFLFYFSCRVCSAIDPSWYWALSYLFYLTGNTVRLFCFDPIVSTTTVTISLV